ncbi:hypothetical protein TSUD_196690 [Trifolium subterraneum]|uniref:F-box domain-containing protein n=1 Tax=Trifolium subterraneum TaxID=3900 RepID=A0A2Z6PB63_TRISU|nr:hypothetical protein TSUD_196690 [Trifolium subterraneum]
MEEKKKTITEQYLPHEVIIQILLWLPVKSLIRFKCVCKLWFSLISHPQFANSHFQLAATTPTHRILFISKSNSSPETRSIDFEAPFNDDSASLNLNFLLPRTYLDLEIKGSCRGFMCLHCCSEIHLWNPSTGAHKQIPLSPNDFFLNFYGFGYDQSTDDYLLVSMSYETDFDDTISSHLEIFSLRANMWKEIEDIDIPYTSAVDAEPKLGLLFSGAIHWIAYLDDLQEDVIVAFDLMERKLLDMHLPEEFDGEPEYSDLWVFGEFLSLSTMNNTNNTVQIWVMKEYKVHSSWTKTHVLSTDSILAWHFSPLCSTKNGDIVGTDKDGTILWKCNDKGQLLEYHSYGNDSSRSQVTLYIESLLSLPADNAQA